MYPFENLLWNHKAILHNYSNFLKYTPIEFLLLVGAIVLFAVLIVELFDSELVNWNGPEACHAQLSIKYDYGYEEHNGPISWKDKFPDAAGCLQSPINICSNNAIVMPSTPLNWSNEYSVLPDNIRICNDGHCVSLQLEYDGGRRPSITGGPLTQVYSLSAVRFRWGPSDVEGSEHAVDFRRYALELQADHVLCDADGCITDMAIVSYVFQVTAADNPYLTPVVSRLRRVRRAGRSATCGLFPIRWLMPAFTTDFYSYCGSLTAPPCTEHVHWLLQPEPIAISHKQVSKFRKICSYDGPLVSNTRPLQNLNNREVFYYSNID